MKGHRSWPVLAVATALTVALLPPRATPAAAAPEGQITLAVHAGSDVVHCTPSSRRIRSRSNPARSSARTIRATCFLVRS